jgi:hypothetical protein
MKDPIVEEVRNYRMEHTRRFRGDLRAICAAMQSVQSASGHKVVRLPPRRLESKTQSGRRGKRALQPC